MPLSIALAQINPTVGDLAGNRALIARRAAEAGEKGAALVVFPELALTGYPPEDLLLKPSFLKETRESLISLAKDLPRKLLCVVGTPDGTPGKLTNAAALLFGGRVAGLYHKRLLPNYGVFDEKRYFIPGEKPLTFSVNGTLVGLTVCEDIWFPKGPAWEESLAGARVIVNLSSSPYHAGKLPARLEVLRARAKETGAALVYCNLVGGQDELVFDGASVAVNPRGRVIAQGPQFEEGLVWVSLPSVPPSKKKASLSFTTPSAKDAPGATRVAPLDRWEEIHRALVAGTRDYVRKNGFARVVLGLSGGVDSAYVAAVAADALGKENVVGVSLPTRFNAKETQNDARAVARNLGIEFHEAPIEPVVRAFMTSLQSFFADKPRDVTEENLQARVRSTFLMALSNKFGWLVLTTGNKSETSVGYNTLYGDTAGGFAVIKDVPKTWVYELVRWRNKKAGTDLVPKSVIDRPPTAELRENQKDEDSLPPYDVLDKIITAYVEEERAPAEIIGGGADPAAVKKAVRLVDVNEYKRRQAPPGVKITPRAFGRDRRMPMTNRYRPYE